MIRELSDLAQVIKSSVYLTKAYSDLENRLLSKLVNVVQNYKYQRSN
ncbi:hypothetical protein [Orientia tsutsugamushi]|nr:hypothetical protein [Orientia tsutsugamushi]